MIQVLSDAREDVHEILGKCLKGAQDELWAWSAADENNVLVLRMKISGQVVQAAQQPPDLEPLILNVEDQAEDDGVLPNQQIIAQELLSRVLIATGEAVTMLSYLLLARLACITHIVSYV